ncbi:TPA: calcium-binding protein [Enterobacter asburiae]|uniref:beta strand repeat-containing protein n=1 Tax=Enterobacter asburiae TaxID=61645 RepID=UPI0010B3B64C|nr:calcium-binding protein [Enterobacter asburiae]BEK81579.1 hypothetical protein EATA8330_44740 [Enterobacter asburiae]HEC5301809.1 calcium-binding protein [Enterobacter asburiae]
MNSSTIIVKTFQVNEIPVPFDKVKIYIDGQDVVMKTENGEEYVYPFAAQFISMSKKVFTFKFSDGKVIPSDELLDYIIDNNIQPEGDLVKSAKNNSENNNDSQKSENSEGDKKTEETEDNSQGSESGNEGKVITKVEEVVVVVEDKKLSSSSSVDGNIDPAASDFSTLAKFDVKKDDAHPMLIPSSSGFPFKSTKVSPQLDTEIHNSTLITTTLQTGDDLNQYTHYLRPGGSRVDGSYEAQYGRIKVDLRQSDDNWTVDGELGGWNYSENSALRIVSVNNVDKLTSIEFSGVMTKDYRLITAETPEGNKLNLKPNEFAVVYPRKDAAFSIDLGFNYQLNDIGQPSYDITTGKIDFLQQKSPSSIINDDGSVNLGYTPNSLTVLLGRGDDILKAGLGNDIYDGGEGYNSLDYSRVKTNILVDLINDATSDFLDVGIISKDSGSVSLGDSIQKINNFKVITGSDFNDKFILNSNGHIIYGGGGDDIFLMNGGSNVLHGGGGVNSIDYTNYGASTNYNKFIVKGLDNPLIISGVNIDFNNGIVTYNDSYSGKDTFTNINVFYGSQGNDRIILSQDNVHVIEESGDNYIEAGRGSYVINGGRGKSILDYKQINTFIDVNLNSGIVNKFGLGKDTISNVHHIIGATGGASFTGVGGDNNILVGVDGVNSFTVDYGYNKLYGGNGSNIFYLKEGNSTIFAGGAKNDAIVKNSILTFYGISGNHGKAMDYINNLEFSGGVVSFIAGEGKSTNNIVSNNGGTITFHSHGDSTFLAKGAGDNNIFIDSGSLLFNSIFGGNNIFRGAADTTTIIMGGEASHEISLAAGASLLLDYSKSIVGEHEVVIDLNKKRSASFDNDTYIDNIFGEGAVTHISGIKMGRTNISLSQLLQEDMTISLYGMNNKIYIGKGLVDISIDNTSNTNIIDYTALSDRLEFDLSALTGNLLRNNGSTVQRGEMLKNVSYIVSNNASGNIYKGSSDFDVTFLTGKGYGNYIIETKGNHTYFTQGYGITYDASDLNESVNFYYTGASGTVQKGGAVTTFTGVDTNNPFSKSNITKVHGTNFNDNFIIDVDNRDGQQDIFSIFTNAGNNTVQINANGLYNINVGDTFNGHSASSYNTLILSPRDLPSGFGNVIFFGENGQEGNVYAAREMAFSTSSIANNDYWMKDFYHIEFNDINEIQYTTTHSVFTDWGRAARDVAISINNGDKKTYLLVNGGGNTIDAGFLEGANNKISLVSYNKNTDSGIIYDSSFSDSLVQFSDGRRNDTLFNFNQLQGSRFNDSIKLKSGQTLISSDGNDILVGNGASYQISEQHTKINANFISGIIEKIDDKSNVVGTDKINGDSFNSLFLSANSVDAYVYAGEQRDMKFYLNQGDVNFFSSNKSNSIDTGAANLTLHYEQLSSGVSFNMVGGRKGEVRKGNGSIDTFTNINQMFGTNNNDEFSFSGGNLNPGKTFKVTTGSGVDSYIFDNSSANITIYAKENSSPSLGERFNFTGRNQNINITSENKGNEVRFINSDIANSTFVIKSQGGNNFYFDNTNATAVVSNANFMLMNSGNELNVISFSNKNRFLNFTVNGGDNEFDFSSGSSSYLIRINADNNSNNIFNVDNSYMGSATITSQSGHDTFNLNSVVNTRSNEVFTININSGNNVTSSTSLVDFNTVIAAGNNSYLNINSGNKNDSYDFSSSLTNSNLNINDSGGENLFNLSGSFLSSKLTSGSQRDIFTLDSVTGSSSNIFVIEDKGGINELNFLNNNHWVSVTSGAGNDTFNLSGENSNININSGAGNDEFSFNGIDSLSVIIDGGTGYDKQTFKGTGFDNFDFFGSSSINTTNIEAFDFTSLGSGEKIILDFSKFTKPYTNDNGSIDIIVGSKDNVSITNDSSYYWFNTGSVDGIDTYSNIFFGDVNIHYETPTSLV